MGRSKSAKYIVTPSILGSLKANRGKIDTRVLIKEREVSENAASG